MVAWIPIASGAFGVLSAVASGIAAFITYVSYNKQKIRSLTHENLEDKIYNLEDDKDMLLDRVKILERDNIEFFRSKIRDVERIDMIRNLKKEK